ncbi:MAG: RHS repeat-associated core domain-containing protein, partial [Acidobacteriales bacterium]
MRRPTHLYVQQGQDSEKLAERTVYGESHPDSHAGTQPGPDLSSLNLRGKVFIQMDSSGISASSDIDPDSGQAEAFDFKGNPLCTVRRFARQYRQRLDWSGIEPLLAADVLDTTALELALQPLLEPERFRTSSTYDALNRPTSVTTPDGTVARPTYNQANLLERLEANLKGEAEVTEFIRDMDYNAKGQKVLTEYANNVVTTFDYDDETLRLTRLTTMRGPDPLQDIFYFYNPAGNITSIRDDSLQTIYFDGEIVRPDLDYTYDALYRLVQAKGREHIGQAESPQTSWNDEFRVRLPHPNNGQAMRNYAQSYEYDDVGNFIRFVHHADGGSWVRTYAYEEPSLIEPGKFNNRLSRTTIGQATENYTYTEHGSMTSMPHLPVMGWDFKDQLEAVDLGSGGTAYYVYDAGGRRVRKVIEQIDGRRREERLYIGSLEIFRRFNGGSGEVDLERETFHLNDDKGRIALVETRTLGEDGSLPRLIRYQMSNHLGSALLELDGSPQAKIVSYEEYYPYGSTSYQAVRSQTDTPKRYRFTGKERDEESGLYYHISRYYAPWLGRWTASDPGGLIDGDNLYRYSRNSPIIFDDPNGMDPPPRTSRYSLGDFPLSAANPLTDPLAHASLFDMAFPGAFGVAFNALDLGNRTRNRVGTGFLNLAEFGITGLLFYGPTVLSHELGHVGGWEDLGVSA